MITLHSSTIMGGTTLVHRKAVSPYSLRESSHPHEMLDAVSLNALQEALETKFGYYDQRTLKFSPGQSSKAARKLMDVLLTITGHAGPRRYRTHLLNNDKFVQSVPCRTK